MNAQNQAISCTAGLGHSGMRLDVFLAACIDVSRSKIQQLVRDGHVSWEGKKPLKPSLPVAENDRFVVVMAPAPEPNLIPEPIPLDILYQDEHLIVINKPPGMVVHPGHGNQAGTLAGALLAHAKSIAAAGEMLRPGIVHRLDKNTSGLLVAALTEQAHRKLSDMIRNRQVTRIYTAFVWGKPVPPSGRIEAPIGRHPKYGTLKAIRPDGRPAATRYETVASYEFVTKLDVRLETGRTHQIRVHLASIGHQVFGDPEYGGREERLGGFMPEIRQNARKLLRDLDRQALHARELSFQHPITGEQMTFQAPLPPDLVRLEQALAAE
jgi:23S rRNA pseudouridine1911/1915/1917 synthase